MVGVVLVVSLVVLGGTFVLAVGDQALRETEQRSEVERTGQSMALFDTQATAVALGDVDRRTVPLGRVGGTYRVDPTAGTISIVNVDRDGDGDDDGDDDPTTGSPNDDEYVLEPTTLGAVVYESGGGQTIAYQGGGVWQQGPDGASRMIAPPEFDYRGGTPMLPVVQVTGRGSVSGSARASISRGAVHTRPVYPNASATFANGDPFANPVRNGSVVVRIESEYADAWGTYFDERTDGEVTYPADGVVAVELVSLAQVGDFDMPLEGGGITVSGPARAHGIARKDAGETAFSIRLRPDDADSAKFSNLQWSLYADEGDREFEMHLRKVGSGDDCKDGSTSTAAHLTIYYSWNGGEDYHGWKTTTPIEAECADLDTSDPGAEIYFEALVVDDDDGDGVYDDHESTDVELEFRTLSSSDLEHFSPGSTLNGSQALDGHSAPGEPVNPTTGSPGTTRTVDQLVNHYFAELPAEFELRVDDKGSDTVSEDTSSGVFYWTGDGRRLTYLHVTTTQVEVELEGDS